MRSGVYITCSLLLLSGCAHGNWRQSVASGPARDGVQTTSDERVAMVEKLLDAAPVPPRAAVSLLRAQSQDNPPVSLTSSSASKTAAVSHDSTTLALIERETRSFSPEDRDRAVAALKAIPSESVPAVLQLWKAGLIKPFAQPSSPVILAPATAADLPPAGTLIARHETPADSGLGQKSPWQSSGVRRADYVPQEMGDQSPVGNASHWSEPMAAKSEQIQRVSAPASGFSSPFADNSNPGRPGDGALIVPPSTSTSYQTNPGAPVVPPDWQSRNEIPSGHPGMNGSTPSSYVSDSGRQLLMPTDWQTQLTPQTHIRSEAPPPVRFNSTPPAAQATVPESWEGPVIRPRERAVTTDSAAATPSNIRPTGFSLPSSESSSGEQGLIPGQTLPAFEVGSLAPAPTTQPRSQAPGTSRNVHHEHPEAQPNGPPPALPMPGSSEPLTLLIRATEDEVVRLVPGTTAEELQYYIERQVYLRLLYLMSGQTESALRPIPHVPAADQEFWTQVLWGVHNYFDLRGVPDHAERAAQTISQFNTAMLRLKERAPLELKKVTFCDQIDGFGEYNTYARNEFTPGERVLVYAEIANFHSELSAEGIYRTRLKSSLQIVSTEAPQEPVDVKIYPVTEDFCRNHRRDYFHSYVVEIPVRCVRGSHVLKLIIEDELSGKVATYPVAFVVR